MNKIYSIENIEFANILFEENIQTIFQANHSSYNNNIAEWLDITIKLTFKFIFKYSESIQFNREKHDILFNKRLLFFLNTELTKMKFKPINNSFINYSNYKKLVEHKYNLTENFKTVYKIVEKHYDSSQILEKYIEAISQLILSILEIDKTI